VKADGLKRCKGVRLYDDSPEPTSSPSPQSMQDLHRDRGSAIVNGSELDSLSSVRDCDWFQT
jgi:hypothetical protein